MSFLPNLFNKKNGILKEPGDKISAEVTKKGRKVVKLKNKHGKMSVVEYPNGRVVDTISYMSDDKSCTHLYHLYFLQDIARHHLNNF